MSLPPAIRAQLIEALARLLLKDLEEPDQAEPEEDDAREGTA